MKTAATRHVTNGTRVFLRSFFGLLRQPVFFALTVVGNGVILLGAFVMYRLELGINPRIHGYLDTLWWAVATATTVGHGEVLPVTTPGKWLGIVMMLLGTTFFCSFTALFASSLVSTEIEEVETSQLDRIERELKKIRDELSSAGK